MVLTGSRRSRDSLARTTPNHPKPPQTNPNHPKPVLEREKASLVVEEWQPQGSVGEAEMHLENGVLEHLLCIEKMLTCKNTSISITARFKCQRKRTGRRCQCITVFLLPV